MRTTVSKSALSVLLGTWLPVALFITWWFASAHSTSFYFPPLSRIVTAFHDNWMFTLVDRDLVPSLERAGLGYLFAAVIGISLGLVLGSSPLLRRAFEPSIEFVRAVPTPALIPIFILLLGISDTEKVFLIAFGAVWPVLLNTVDGVRGVDASFHDTASIYGFSRFERLRSVVLPAAGPQIFTGLRISLSISLLLVVFAELYASQNGVGFFILNAEGRFQIPDMWSGLFVLAIVALVINILFVAVERRVLFWHRGWRASVL